MGRPKIHRTAEEIKAIRKRRRDKHYAIVKANRVKNLEYIVYILSDPRNGMIKYVGMTGQSLKKRLHEHMNISPSVFRRYPDRAKWIKELRDSSLAPVISVHEIFTNYDDAIKEETDFAKKCASLGFDLVNINYGREHSHKTKKVLWPNKKIRHPLGVANRKPIIQLTKSGEFVKRWDYIALAAKTLNIQEKQIINCCKQDKVKNYFSAGKFKWMYASECEKVNT